MSEWIRLNGVSYNNVKVVKDKAGCFENLQFKQSNELNLETLFKVPSESKLQSLSLDAWPRQRCHWYITLTMTEAVLYGRTGGWRDVSSNNLSTCEFWI